MFTGREAKEVNKIQRAEFPKVCLNGIGQHGTLATLGKGREDLSQAEGLWRDRQAFSGVRLEGGFVEGGAVTKLSKEEPF